MLILKLRTIFEIIVVLYTVVLVLISLNELYIQKWRLFLKALLDNPSRIAFLFALACILIIIPLRVSCNTYGEDILVAMTSIFLGFSSIYFARFFTFSNH